MRRTVFLVALAALACTTAGCSFESLVTVRFTPGSPVRVTESVTVEQTARRVHGVTTRRRQVVRIDCSTTIAYDVREATGTAVLVQTYLVRLRTRPLARGTPYDLDCAGPLVVQLPAAASVVRASAGDVTLPVHPASTLALAFRKRLRPDPGTRFAVVEWPGALSGRPQNVTLELALPAGAELRQRALSAATVMCGGARYLQPILPAADRIAETPLFSIEPSGGAAIVTVPRVAGGFRTQFEVTRSLSCGAGRVSP